MGPEHSIVAHIDKKWINRAIIICNSFFFLKYLINMYQKGGGAGGVHPYATPLFKFKEQKVT